MASTRNFRRGMPQGKHLAPRHVGPYKVTHRRGKLAYTLDIPNTRKHTTFHFDLLKKHRGDMPTAPPPVPPNDADALADDYHSIDHVIAHRYRSNALQFLVRWTGYDETNDTWVAQSKVTQAAKDEYRDTERYELCKARMAETKERNAPKQPKISDPEPSTEPRRSSRHKVSINALNLSYARVENLSGVQGARIRAMLTRYGPFR